MTRQNLHIFLLFLIFFLSVYQIVANEKIYIEREELSPSVAIYLSGGGARGISQIGVLQGLESENIPIDYIAGTSMGGVIGGLFASGYKTDEIIDIIINEEWQALSELIPEYERNNLTLDQKYIKDKSFFSFKFQNFNFLPPEGISYGKEYYGILQSTLYSAPFKSNNNYNNLFIPLRIAATDLTTGSTKYFDKGNIINVIRASATFPLLYTPVKMDSSIYIDGGMFANIPIKAPFNHEPDIKIAVDNTSPIYDYKQINSTVTIADQATSIWMKYFEKQDLKNADIIIEPDLGAWGNRDFKNIDSVANLGKIAFDNKKEELLITIRKHIKNNISLKFLETALEIDSLTQYLLAEEIIALLADESVFAINIEFADSTSNFKLIPEHYDTIKNINLVNNSGEFYKEMKTINERYNNRYYKKSVIKEISRDIINIYIKNGFSFARVDYVSYSDGAINISINPAEINSINISTESTVSKYLVRRELAFEVGEIASADDFIQTWQNLFSCGLFKDFSIDYTYNTDGCIDIDVFVNSSGNQEINIGNAIDDERGFRLGLQFNQLNLFNSGTNANLSSLFGDYDKKVGFSINNNRIGRFHVGFSLSSIYSDKAYPSYQKTVYAENDYLSNLLNTKRKWNKREQRFIFMGMLNASIYRAGSISIGLRQGFARTVNVDSSGWGDFHSVNLLRAEALFDTENRLVFSDKGYKLQLLFETNFLKTVKHISFTKIFVESNYNFNLSPLVITPKIIMGSGDQTMPVEEFFNLGGINSFYGFQYERLRGRQLVYASVNFTYKLPVRLFFDTYISTRYDYGNIWNEFDEINLREMYNGIGGAIAFDTPIGPAQFAMGKAFTSKDVNGVFHTGPVVLYFYIGMRL